MSRKRKMDFAAGVQDGIPICLGYIAVSFTFGIMAKNAGLSTWEAVLISLTNLTSAGQFAGLSLITASASYFEMAVTQLIINLRYSLMSCALSQKIDNHYPSFHRFLIAYSVTDEVFGVSVSRPGKITPWYSYGVMALAAPGWTLGTFLGVVSGNILPDRVVSALSVALYGMFIAIIIPPARKNHIVAGLVALSFALSLACNYLPGISAMSDGTRTILLTVVISAAAAVLFPVKDQLAEEGGNDE